MQITAARPRSQVSSGTPPGRIRVHDALSDLALDALRELLGESPRPLVAKVERLRQLTEYGFD